MAAPEGNRNAKKERKGIQVNFYLTKDEAVAIRQRFDQELTDTEVRSYARDLAKNGIDLGIQGLDALCRVKGCYWVTEITCAVGTCAPATNWCRYHYEQAHLPEDERDEIDLVTGKSIESKGVQS